uniref:protein SSUH2 homolog isoform X1 n=2 Tax=Pristiophorus japonicus TaxID=55135 RepID=UPI00398EF3C7
MDPQQAEPWAAPGNPPMATDGPYAPPAGMLDTVAGYESIATGGGGEGGYLPPPVYPMPNAEGGQPQPDQQWSIPSITEDTAKQALIKFASDHYTYRNRPAEEMVIKELKPYNMYRYRLDTFTESRSPECKSEPFHSQTVDNCGFGPPPLPWDVVVDTPTMFEKNKKTIKVPHTGSVKGCHKCMAMGKAPCSTCSQTGRVKCRNCHGNGTQPDSEDRCDQCLGSGIQSCESCSGCGRQTCTECEGQGQLFCYIQLTIKWENNKFEHIVEQQCELPTKVLKKVKGQNLFTDQQFQVFPLVGFPEPRINQVSQQGIQEHWAQFGKKSRIIQQRHTVELIPVTEVHFQWKEKDHTYFVFGTENKVKAPDYPGKICTIL